MRKKTQDIEDLTLDVLNSIPKPWPDYITLLVFLAIEHNERFLQRYESLVGKHNKIEKYKGNGKGHVNATIGMHVKGLTGRTVTSKGNPAKSRLSVVILSWADKSICDIMSSVLSCYCD
ncbi:MAG: hypothetical protein R3293_28010 [Candidatus Promineifilaceae bacterium]|nr:hypothetical protein [Candidatus Promineifilaceae bacterium]